MAVDTLLRTVWTNMKHRCLNPEDKRFAHYGGRGIAICPEWLDFEVFAADMGPHPGRGLTLDRIDNDGNYEPGNCRWATRAQQVQNRSIAVLISVNGEQLSIKQIAERTGLGYGTIQSRVDRGMSPEKIAYAGSLAPMKPTPPHIAKYSAERRAATHCVNGHELTPDNVYTAKSGKRVCLICRRVTDKRRNEKNPDRRKKYPSRY